MKKAFLPGVFDPPTLGHLDLIKRARNLCDHLIIGVGNNSRKQPLFSIKERLQLIQKCLEESSIDADCIAYENLTADCAKQLGVDILIRGVRSSFEFEKEYHLSLAYQKINRNLETIFLFSSPQFLHINSSWVREIAQAGQKIDAFVPSCIESLILKRLTIKP